MDRLKMAVQLPLDIHPESKTFLELLQKNNVWTTFFESMTVDKQRSALEAMVVLGKSSKVYDGMKEEIFIPYEEVKGGIPVFVYTPQSVLPDASVLIYFHGGAFISGTREHVDETCKNLSSQARCIVVNVEYRLAPEHKFPAFDNDAVTVAKWVLANRKSIGGTEKSKVGVSGDSAGGQIAASVSQVVPGLDFQILIYPLLGGGSRDLPSYKEFKDGPMLTEDYLTWVIGLIVDKKDLNDPRFAILRSEKYDHLPPTLLIVAQIDPLRDDSYEYSRKLTAAGVENELLLVKGAIHGFFTAPSLFVELSSEPYAKAVEFIGKVSQRQ